MTPVWKRGLGTQYFMSCPSHNKYHTIDKLPPVKFKSSPLHDWSRNVSMYIFKLSSVGKIYTINILRYAKTQHMDFMGGGHSFILSLILDLKNPRLFSEI